MKIFSAKNDIFTEDFVIIKDDVVAVLEEDNNSVLVSVKKENGFDFKDSDYKLKLEKSLFDIEFEKIDSLNESDEEEVTQDFKDPKIKDDEKHIITQEIDRIEKLLQQNEQDEELYQECSTKVKENVEKRINGLQHVSETEESDLTESISTQVDKLISLVENKTITKTMKTKVKTVIENFLT